MSRTTSTYFADKRGEVDKDIRTETFWDGDNLVIMNDANKPNSSTNYDVVNLRIFSLVKNRLIEKVSIRMRLERNLNTGSGGYFTSNIATRVYNLTP